MEYQICTECVMDTTNPNIQFNEIGVCDTCQEVKKTIYKYKFTKNEEQKNLEILSNRIKDSKKGEYDSILGLSGGVDSSYIAYLAKIMGLNPLCVHFDNGWNSDIAVKNIRKIIDITGYDLFTYVIDWPEFRDLQRAYFKSGVIDIEAITDHAIFAALFKIRKQYGIKTVLSGTNYTTEHGMPHAWLWNKMDLRNIKAIQRRFGDMRIKSFPTMNTITWLLMREFQIGGVFEEPLNSINYKKTNAMVELQKYFNWEYYGGKHYESIFTKFYQAYVLPTKYCVDKRKVHLSALIRNGEISRADALYELSQPLYNNTELLADKRFVLKKLGFTEDEFQGFMAESPVPHDAYPTDTIYIKPLIKLSKKIIKRIRL